MREFLKSTSRRLPAGWFWPVILLALPNCAGLVGIDDWRPSSGDPGDVPLTWAIMCDIPQNPDAVSITCADENTDLTKGISMSHAAVALVEGPQTSSVAFDYSQTATSQCPGGFPLQITFRGPFPDGLPFCLNCQGSQPQVPTVFANGNDTCREYCKDLDNANPGSIGAMFCDEHAHVSTNFDPGTCYPDVCSPGGTAHDFPDPRRNQEDVIWDPLMNTHAEGNTLIRDLATDGTFNAGGVGKYLITHGDAWVEFNARENDKGHVLGVSPGPDTSPSFDDIAFGISLDTNNNVYIIEGGVVVAGPFPPYQPTDRFRVYMTENNDVDNTASISYFRNGALFATQVTAPNPKYPLRVDASLGAFDAALEKVTMVRIVDYP